jgi:hypothetical protein
MEETASRDACPFCRRERAKVVFFESNSKVGKFELSRMLKKWNAKPGANHCSWDVAYQVSWMLGSSSLPQKMRRDEISRSEAEETQMVRYIALCSHAQTPQNCRATTVISYKPRASYPLVKDQSVKPSILKLLPNNLLAQLPQLPCLTRADGVRVEFIQVYRLNVRQISAIIFWTCG